MAHEVQVARRQLGREPLKLMIAVAGVALAVALVGLLLALRSGIGRQTTTYEDHVGAQIYVAAPGTRTLLVDSVLPATLARQLRRAAPGTAVAPITINYETLTLHGHKVVTSLVGSDPGNLGGPWRMAAGRAPRATGEIAIDKRLAGDHGFEVGETLPVRGELLRVVGLTDGTSSWMGSLLFATRAQVNHLQRRGDVANLFVLRTRQPAPRVRAELRRRFPELAVLSRERIAADSRQLQTGTFSAPLLMMVSVAFGVGILVIGLTIYGFVGERRREFGMLKAIGSSNGRLYRLVGTIALAITLVGLGLGLVLERVAGSAIHGLAPKFLFVFEPGHLLLAVAGALVMALVGAWIPARILARLDPAEVFRR